MKIAIHTHEFNISKGGPCTKRMYSFAEAFQKAGHDVVILTGSQNKKDKEKLKKKFKIYYCSSFSFNKKKNVYRFLCHFSFALTSFFVGLFKLRKIDYLITTSPPPFSSITGYLVAKLKGAKVIYDVRDIWPDVALEMGSFDKKSIYYKVFNFIACFMYKHSDYITTVTPTKVEKIKKYCQDNSSKVWYVSNGLDDNLLNFKVDNRLIKKYSLKTKFTIVYMGKIGLAQNLDAMVELARLSSDHNNMQFLIFGAGVYKENLLKKIEELKLSNIYVENKIDYKKTYTILKYSKMSFISLKNNNMIDSVPTKIFDSLGLGCPVLLLASGDSTNILKESRLGESAKNMEELIKKFNFMINNMKEYKKNARYAKRYIVNNYSRKNIAESFVEKLNNE